MNSLVNRYAEEIVRKLGRELEALVLVGSYARGESIEGCSDIEFWVVVKNLARVTKPALNGNIALGFTTSKHLKRLKPYIYTVEVKKFGQVLSGDKDILSSIPDYKYEDIDPIDGFILLNNRIVEQLILLNNIEDGKPINQYEFDKGYIQLVNAILVLRGKYRSLYPEKAEEFHRFYPNSDSEMALRINEAFNSIRLHSVAVIRHDEALRQWQELRRCFRKVWSEQERILGRVRPWVRLLSSGRIRQVLVYRQAAGIYFSQGYQDRHLRDRVITKWEYFVK